MNAAIPLADLTVAKLLARQAAERGGKTCLTELASMRRWSYAALDAWTARIASALAAHGVAHGTHVGVLMENSAEHLALFLALARLGAVAVPVNTASRGELLAYYFRQGDVEAIVADEALLDRLEPVLPELSLVNQVIAVGRAGNSVQAPASLGGKPVHDFAGAVSRAADTAQEREIKCTDLVLLSYTSGTSGPSRPSMWSQAAALSYGTGGIEAHGFVESDVVYVCLPLFHNNALLTGSITALVGGSAIVLAERFSVSRFWPDIRASGATITNMLGSMASFLWTQPPAADDADNALRLVSMSPIPSFVDGFEQRFGLKAISNYGLSDFATVTSLVANAPESKRRSIGKARSYYEVQVVDDDDLPCADGVTGELVIRTREPWRAATGYYKMPEATAAANRNQWFHTGDRGWRDPDGYFWFVDRKKDCIRRRGENISAFEVEQVLLKHPAIANAAVFPVAQPEGDQEVGAALVLRDGHAASETELVEYCARNMAYFMVPRFVNLVAHLPTTMNQKIEKFKLKAAMESALASVWDREQHGIVLKR